MASDVLTATELIAVLTVYCVVFCPILYWVIGGSLPFKRSLDSLEKQSHA
ncbi:hypothetical protein N836_18705 [Leptolyngbya sp. Heron Island J]|nr:hypothetical protein [Leptolyngbya sp. Heron Island J]ESA34100.1 hypothetical protein N836_18705 [Leptolyngbya sp. Heron Island J]